ncbi:MAG: VWA domain-containing protein [Spirochaetales bacterium]|nr:VWA domain-containing protein [Spirochaetales bacterium]
MQNKIPGILRLISMVLFLLAFFNITWDTPDDSLDIVYLLDVSASMNDDMQKEALQFINDSMKVMQARDRASLVLFARGASVEFTGERGLPVHDPYASFDITETNISLAIKQGLSIEQDASFKRIVLLSDGNETMGDSLSLTESFPSLSADLYTVPIDTENRGEVYIEALLCPQETEKDAPHELRILIGSDHDTQATLILTCDGETIRTDKVNISSTGSSITAVNTLKREGYHTYRAVILPLSDGTRDNNAAEAVTHVTGRAKILYLFDASRPSPVSRLLASSGVILVREEIKTAVITREKLVDYSAVICDGIASSSLSQQAMKELESFVKDLGGGLFFLCPPETKSLKGYIGSTMEKILPVNFEYEDKKQSLSILLVVDKSSSMEGGIEREKIKLDAVKSSVMNSLARLDPDDRIGLLAFDTEADWVFKPVRVFEKDRIMNTLEKLSPGGGTDIYNALAEAYREMIKEPSILKYIILLSDGNTETTKEYDYRGLAEAMAGDGIHLSSIAIGADANTLLMRNLSQWGNGVFYKVERLDDIPLFYLREVDRLTSLDSVDNAVKCLFAQNHAVTGGFSEKEIPPLAGYFRTILKTAGQNILQSESNNPLLAFRYYGTGKTMIFTSSLSSGWGSPWAAWPKASVFLERCVQWLKRGPSDSRYSLNQASAYNTTKLILDAVNEDGSYINGRSITAFISGPGQESLQAHFSQKAPGRYTGAFIAQATGTYFITVIDEETRQLLLTSWHTKPYPEEFKPQKANRSLLEKLAHITKGELIEIADNDAIRKIFSRKYVVSGHPLNTLFVFIGLALFILELILRNTAFKK